MRGMIRFMEKTKIAHLKGILFTAFLFSLFIMLLGMRHYSQKRLFVLSFLGFLIAGMILDMAICHFPPRAKRFLSGEALSQKLYSRLSDKKIRLLLWFLISLFFAPAYIALFPGTFGYDAPVQAAQYFGEMELTGANPLLHTYLLGTFLSFGEKILKNASLGFALFTLMQGLLATHVLAKSFLFLKKIHTPFTVMAIGLLWILLNPTLHVLTFNATKDILLGICFLHFLLDLADTALAMKDTEKAGSIRLLLSGILMCLMRNAAVYLVGALLLIMLPFLRKCKKTIIILCTVFLISLLFSRFFTNTLNIPAGDARENMCIPIQQLAAVSHSAHYGTEPVNITPEQTASIKELIPEESLEVFLRDTVDLVKAEFDTETFRKDPRKYISLYLSVGRQNPGIYIRAFRDMVLPYFDMTTSTRRSLSLEETFPEFSHLHISGYGLLPSFYAFLENQIEAEHYFLLLQPGISIWLMAMGIGISICRKNGKILLCIFPAAIYFIGILLGPMALLRYLYPMMLATPLLFGILFGKI